MTSTDVKPSAPADRPQEEDSDDESDILEESPCGRWAKRKEQVDQRDVPGIDAAYLAMDTEEGVEVVWNEVLFSERKNFKSQEEKIRQVFDNLTQLEHPNIVKFHKYWMETQTEKPRVVFITEYMSSGSLKQFLKRTKKSGKKLPHAAWKRWCTQILSALSYLHSCTPSIIHGNLTCDTIFIQHNGLVKIGSVAPDAIHHHVKSCRDNIKNMHFVAPEYGCASPNLTPAVDIFSFGMCALEMAALEIQGNGDSGTLVTEDHINSTIESLEPGELPINDFVRRCINDDPELRPTARQLLFHSVLFEVPSLKLLSAHALVNHAGVGLSNIAETISDEVVKKHYEPGVVVAEIVRLRRPNEIPTSTAQGEEPVNSHIRFPMTMADVNVSEKLEKFVEDVKFGIYPLTCFELPHPHHPPPPRQTASSPEVIDSVKSTSPEPPELETRRVVNMMCNVKDAEDGHGHGPGLIMTILVRMDDKMNRQLSCVVSETDTGFELATELVYYGFIHEADRDRMGNLIEDALCKREAGSPSQTQPLSPTAEEGPGPDTYCLASDVNSNGGSNDGIGAVSVKSNGSNGSVHYPLTVTPGVISSCS